MITPKVLKEMLLLFFLNALAFDWYLVPADIQVGIYWKEKLVLEHLYI